MATQKSTQTPADRIVEQLLGQITMTAYSTEQRLRETPGDVPEIYESEIELLRHTVARLGWMADLALKSMGSNDCLLCGDATAWLLAPSTVEALVAGERS
jgi:hypothetical protein